MAHFAKIGDTSKVLAVLTLNNKNMLNADGEEEESIGQKYLEKHNNWPAQMWIQTSYNTSCGKHYDNKTKELSTDQSKALRGNYAGIGYTWDKDNQIFWRKKPYASWVKDISDAQWHSPIGDVPALTAEEQAASTLVLIRKKESDVRAHRQAADPSFSHYVWNEDGQSWDLNYVWKEKGKSRDLKEFIT